MEFHRLTGIDSQTETATCSVCGPASIRKKGATSSGKPKWKCRAVDGARVHLPPTAEWTQKRRERDWKRRNILMFSVAQYHQKVLEQNGVCEICKQLTDGISLAVDHDHSTGQIRGLLCANCNQALGKIKDSTDTARNMAKYLEKYALMARSLA